MIRNIVEYKTMGDLLGAVKQALRRFTPNGSCLIQIENLNYENKVIEQNLMITDGKTGIRITEIPEEDMSKLKTMFNEIAVPYTYQENKWVSVFKDPDYSKGVMEELEELFK